MFEIDFFSQSPDTITKMAHEKVQSAVQDWEKQVWQFVVDWYNPSITSVSVFTSGSTGAPKQITHSKTAMLNSAAATCTALQLTAGTRALLCLPVSKISGMMMMVRSIYLKMPLLCIQPSIQPLSELPVNHHIGFAAFTPMQFHAATGNYSVFKKADQIQKIILGGEDIRAEMLENIQKMDNEVYITFGMTETISHIALKRLNGPSPDSSFKVLPGIQISTDGRDCMIITAPQLGQPDLITNDVIQITGNNEFKWLGRADNAINSGGLKIFPEEIEQQLAPFIEAPYFVGSLPDNVSGEKLVIAIETTELNPIEKQKLKEALNGLEKLHRPRQILLIPQFVRTPNGKIKRKESLQNITKVIALSEQPI